MPNDLYALLEVAPDATPEQIKRAYAGMVRRHPPEKDPEQFKRIREAYEKLSDAHRRAEYDAHQIHGEEIDRLMNEAIEHKNKSEWKEAIRRFKRVALLSPGLESALNLLGICYTNDTNWDEAKKVYKALTDRHPDNGLYWFNYACVYIEETIATPQAESEKEAKLARAARKLVERCLQIEPDNSEYVLAMGRAFRAEREYARAEEWAEKAIDKRPHAPDIEAFLFLAWNMVYSNRLDRIPPLGDRIFEMLPSEPAKRAAAASRFARVASELLDDKRPSKLYQPADAFLSAAIRIDPDTKELHAFWESIHVVVEACNEYDRVKEDTRIIQPVRFLLAVYTDEARGLKLDRPRDQVFDSIFAALRDYSVESIRSSAIRVRKVYRNLYKLNPKGIDTLINLTPSTPSQGPSSSCFVVTATFGTPDAPIVQQFRRYRDERLTKTWLGRRFIEVYYRVGPAFAAVIRRCTPLRRLSAWLLRGLAAILPK
jgi:tetratricopeptide (TPR) repeat protein